MARIIQIPGRSGFYLRVVVPRGKLRQILGTCDVVRKVGKTKEEALKNKEQAEKEINNKFDLRLKDFEKIKTEKDTLRAKSRTTKLNLLNETQDITGPLSQTSSLPLQDSKLSNCIALKSERTKFEQFKADSKYLQEPLASELKNDIDHFTNDAVQLLKFHGSYQQDDREKRSKGSGKDWQMMLRLRSPGGHIPTSLFIALDDLSNRLGNGTLRATTRQAFQMHGIRKDDLHEVIKTIILSMGSTLAACGDISRNVMAPPPPYERGGYPAVRKLAVDIADVLSPSAAEGTYLDLWVNGDLSYRIRPSKSVKVARSKQLDSAVFSGDNNEPLYGSTYMPRKFKCAVTVPGDNSVDLLTHDIGLVAFTNNKGVLQGCNAYVGGGMGRTHNNESTFARKAECLGYIEGKDVLEFVQAILALQRDYGDRKTRRHARMKYLLNDMGLDWFKIELQSKYFQKDITQKKKEPKSKLEDYLGWHRQKGKIWFIGIPLLSGRLNGEKKQGLRKIVEKYQLDIRLTPNQDIILCNVGAHQKSSIDKEIRELNLWHSSMPKLERHALACPALPLCGLAMTEAERDLPSILNRIEKLLIELNINKSILIRMTGCPNGCARPYMAELALVGSGVSHYQLWLGGTPNLQELAKPYLQRMHIDELESTLRPIFQSWGKEGGNSSFGEFLNKIDDQKILSLLQRDS